MFSTVCPNLLSEGELEVAEGHTAVLVGQVSGREEGGSEGVREGWARGGESEQGGGQGVSGVDTPDETQPWSLNLRTPLT